METSTNDFWSNLNSIYLFLEPFKNSIEQIQKDNASVYSVWNNFQKLLSFINQNKFHKFLMMMISIILFKYSETSTCRLFFLNVSIS
jgi:hypothetical protein